MQWVGLVEEQEGRKRGGGGLEVVRCRGVVVIERGKGYRRGYRRGGRVR